MSSNVQRLTPVGATILALGLVAHLGLQLRPAYDKVAGTVSGRDFASYYYAVKVAEAGRDPYSVDVLGAQARKEKTRKGVQPYFYPPPFLLTMLWAPPMPLGTASLVMLGLNEVLLAACLWLAHRFFAVAPWAIALLLVTYSPIPDNAWMGQANLLALLPALLGLTLAPKRPWAGGVLVGTAAMLKMSPALFLLYFAMRKNWRAVLAAMATAVVLSVVSLPLVDYRLQENFYRIVLPGFAKGDYHGLTVALNLPANHSIPDIFNHLWPGPTPTSMSDAGLRWSRAANLGLLAAWALVFRREGGVREEALAIGALTILMTIFPAYTYEHHLVFLLLPVAALATAAAGARKGWLVAFAVLYFFLAWPLDWLNEARGRWPAWEVVFRESKFLALLGMLGLMGWLRHRR